MWGLWRCSRWSVLLPWPVPLADRVHRQELDRPSWLRLRQSRAIWWPCSDEGWSRSGFPLWHVCGVQPVQWHRSLHACSLWEGEVCVQLPWLVLRHDESGEKQHLRQVSWVWSSLALSWPKPVQKCQPCGCSWGLGQGGPSSKKDYQWGVNRRQSRLVGAALPVRCQCRRCAARYGQKSLGWHVCRTKFARKIFFGLRNILTKNALCFPEFVRPLFCGSAKSRQLSGQISLQKIKKSSPTSFCRRARRRNKHPRYFSQSQYDTPSLLALAAQHAGTSRWDRCTRSGPAWECWRLNAARKTGGFWYSTMEQGMCAQDSQSCTWRAP